MFDAFRAAEKPTSVVFADGRTGGWFSFLLLLSPFPIDFALDWVADSIVCYAEAIPDMTRMIRPSRFGEVATYLLFGLGGVVVGEQIGLASGLLSAKRLISQDPQSRERIVTAFRRFRVDQLRRQATKVEKEQLPFFGF